MPINRSERMGPAIDAIIEMLKSKPKSVRAGQEGFTIYDLTVNRETKKNLQHIRIAMRLFLELNYIRHVGQSRAPGRGKRSFLKVYKFNRKSFEALRRRRERAINGITKEVELD